MDWADELAASVDGPQVVNDSKTPSGTVHVGSLRGPVILDVITRALRAHGLETTLLYGVDDLDPMDAQALLSPDAIEREMGRPLAHVPDPAGDCHASYARHFAGDLHRHVLGPRHRARSLLLDERHLPDRPAGPVHPHGAGPGRDRARGVPPGRERPAPRPLAAGRRHLPQLRQGRDDDRVRLGRRDGVDRVQARPRRVGDRLRLDRAGEPVRRQREAALEPRVGGAVEPVRRDDRAQRQGPRHGRRVARPSNAIAREVFEREPPRNFPYEFLNIGGRKMSTSKGRGAAAHTIGSVIPPEQLRFLFVRQRPESALDFDPEGTDAIPRLFDEFDRLGRRHGRVARSRASCRPATNRSSATRCSIPRRTSRPRPPASGPRSPTSRCSSRSRASTSGHGSRRRRGAP